MTRTRTSLPFFSLPYELVPGFKITPEIQYADNFDFTNADSVSGILRFTRSF